MPCSGPYAPTDKEIDEITNKILNFLHTECGWSTFDLTKENFKIGMMTDGPKAKLREWVKEAATDERFSSF